MCKKTNMSKRLLLTIATVLAIAMQVMGQAVSTFEVPVFEKIVKVTANSVNIRKLPNVQSAKVGAAENGQVMAVVGETGDWYKVFTSEWTAPYAKEGGNATIEETRVGYIMKKFCHDANIKEFKRDNSEVYVRQSGRYKGVCMFTTYSGTEEDWYGLTFSIGKLIDNVAVLPYRICANEDGDTGRNVEFQKSVAGYVIAFKQGITDGTDAAFDKLTDADIEYIIKNASKMSKKSGNLIFYTDEKKYEMADYSNINYGRGLHQLQTKQCQWLSASSATTNRQNNETVFDQVDQMPSFPGGASGLNSWLSENIHYPAVAKENKVQGRVIVTFVVERDGSISNAKLAKSVDPALDREAVRVVSAMPNWNPGRKNGEPVRVKYTVPITFRL